MDNPIVHLERVNKTFGEMIVAHDVTLSIQRGEFLTLLGPSGCGKTTTLRMIAGFEQPTSGTVKIDGVDQVGKPPYERRVNTVFQHYALFPHLTVEDNVGFGLSIRREPREKIREKSLKALELVKLTGHEKKMPAQLSGGQKQRVALARALVLEPQVLLLDEPLGALDFKLRKEMQVEVKALQRRLGLTFVLVTHDQEEALVLSDRIAVMNKGRIEQLDTPQAVYERPRTQFVADFLGFENFIGGTVQGVVDGEVRIATREGPLVRVVSAEVPAIGAKVFVAVRPEKIRIAKDHPATAPNVIPGTIEEKIFLGWGLKFLVHLSQGTRIAVLVQTPVAPELAPLERGAPVELSFEPGHAVVLPDGEARP